MVAIAKKVLGIDASLYTFLQVLGLTVFEKMPIKQVFERADPLFEPDLISNQLNPFDF